MVAKAQALATDFAQLAALRAKARAQDPAAIRQAAQQFEALFTQQLLKAAHSSPLGDDLMGGDGNGDMVRDMFDQQIATQMASGKGLGLADMLVRQLQMGQEPGPGTRDSGLGHNDTAVIPAKAGIQFPSTSVPAMHLDPRLHNVTLSSPPGSRVPSPESRGFASAADFVAALKPDAEAAAKELGISPHVLIAQAALETGWGKHLMRGADGKPTFNFFGIKADKRWDGERSTHATQEFEHGQMQPESAQFRSYSSIGEAFADYVRFLKSNPRYAEALQHGGSGARFAASLQKAGYATDPAYAAKLMQLAGGATMQVAMASPARAHRTQVA